MKKLIFLIACVCLIGMTGCAVAIEADGHKKNEKYVSNSVDISAKVENVIVNWDYGTVAVTEHQGSNVEFFETSSKKITAFNKLTYIYDEGTKTLTINYYNDNLSYNEIVNNKKLYINVPKNKEFNTFQINSNKANVTISDYVKVRIHSLFFYGDIEVNTSK